MNVAAQEAKKIISEGRNSEAAQRLLMQSELDRYNQEIAMMKLDHALAQGKLTALLNRVRLRQFLLAYSVAATIALSYSAYSRLNKRN